jgi:ParB-like chromosome segregation protein Spo0J
MNWNPTEEVIDRAVALDDLAPHPRNYKAHPAAQIERLATSLVAFGQPRTVAVWRGTILAGHGVTQAARHLGWRQIRASIVPDAWSAERAQAYVVADNETQRGADVDEEALAALIDEATQEVDLGALGFDQAGLDALLAGITVPDFESVGIDEQGRLDQKAQCTCPECGHVFTP